MEELQPSIYQPHQVRQWQVGDLVNDGHQLMLILGEAEPRSLVYISRKNKVWRVWRMSARFYECYSALIIQRTDLVYTYQDDKQVERDIENDLFTPYFPSESNEQRPKKFINHSI